MALMLSDMDNFTLAKLDNFTIHELDNMSYDELVAAVQAKKQVVETLHDKEQPLTEE